MSSIITIIAPVFVIILLGYGLGHTRLFGERDARVIINFVWYVAIPALLLQALAPRELPDFGEMLIVLAYYMALFLVYIGALFVAKMFGQTPAERSVYAFVACFGNGAFLGIPLIEAIYGAEGVRLLLIILSFHALTLLPISTLLMERALADGTEEATNGWRLFKRTFEQLLRNPVIISLAVGLSWSALGIPFPDWLDRVTALPAAAAAPAGLFAAGLSMTGVRIAGDIVQSGSMVGMKLVALPVFVYIFSHYVFGLPDIWVGTAVITAALPSGMVAYSFATKYDVAVRRAASAVLISTGMSAATLSVLLFVLGIGQ